MSNRRIKVMSVFGTRPEAIIRSPPAAEEQAYRWAKVRGPVFASSRARALARPSVTSVSTVV